MKEIKYFWEAQIYSCLLHHYETCVEHILEVNYGFETIAKNEIKKLNEDIARVKKIINNLLLDEIDTFEEEFQDEKNHPIIYSDKIGWEIFKSYYKKLK